jgi:hypothetical protein
VINLNEEERKGNSLMSQRDSMNHNHIFITMADVSDGHQHVLIGTSGTAIYSGDTHVHRIRIKTSFDPKSGGGHWHFVDIRTGPAIDVPKGEHTHYFCGQTSQDNGHRHSFRSVIDTAPDSECDNHN